MDLGLDGKLCVVTGASRGIGLEVGRSLCAEGGRVLFVGRDADALVEAAEDCGGEYIAADVTDPEMAELIIATCAEQMGGIDVLVNNAGTSFARSLDELADEDWQGQWELNVMAPMRLMRAAAPRMAQGGGGRIVNVCSSAGKRPSQTNAAYSVTKAAQLSLSRVFADAYAADNVLVNAVAPGAVASELWTGPDGLAEQIAAARGGTREQALAAQADKIPLGRLAEPREIADIVVFLCSARASNVTGAAWSADGGTVPIIV
jgi:3-oxoacyl-[acyl-carrier protein] reductase